MTSMKIPLIQLTDQPKTKAKAIPVNEICDNASDMYDIFFKLINTLNSDVDKADNKAPKKAYLKKLI